MSSSLNFILVLVTSVVFSSCAKEDGLNLQPKLDAKPQVKDILSGKSNTEVLKMKYKELRATCALNAVKTTQGYFVQYSSGNTPVPPIAPENPIFNPTENTLTYDLKLQQLVDQELVQDVKSKLSITKDGQTLNVDITFKPVVFKDSVNLDINQKKYIMKHTPNLSYLIDYQLLHADDAAIVGKTSGRIYEKINGQKNAVVAIEISSDQYSFDLECNLERTINSENPDYAAEFENQWAELDCHTPKNNAEKDICK